MKSYAQLKEFAKNVKFPSHGLILRKAKDNNEQVVKGIRTWKVLKEKFNLLHAAYGEVYAETDMRAMHNSTRMKVIQKAVTKLIKIIKTPCPKCSMPGFSIKKAIPGKNEVELFISDISVEKKRITAEACVHHLWFSDEDYEKLGSLIKWNPAIKMDEDRKGLLEGLKSCKLDIIATDHTRPI